MNNLNSERFERSVAAVSGAMLVALCALLPIAARAADSNPPSSIASNSATLPLSDGSTLIVGTPGREETRASKDVWQVPAKGSATERKRIARLQHARAQHTATMLPNGRVLVVGGRDQSGALVDSAEIFDLASGQSTPVDIGTTARAQHTATLLLNGQVLIVGGVDANGRALSDAVLWDSYGSGAAHRTGQLGIARALHSADWTAGKTILISGGFDDERAPIAESERYSPAGRRFESQANAAAQEAKRSAPAIVESLPEADARNVGISTVIGLRFDRVMQAGTLNASTVTLFGPDGPVKISIVAAERGRLLFVTPQRELRPDASYTVFINGAKDENGASLPFSARGFRTAKLSADTSIQTASGSGKKPGVGQDSSNSSGVVQGQNVDSDDAEDNSEYWRPAYGSKWRSGRVFPHSRDAMRESHAQEELLSRLPEKGRARLRARMQEKGELIEASYNKAAMSKGVALTPGSSAISGQVLRLNGKPLANVTITMGTHKTQTDTDGEFRLMNVPKGTQVLVIDGRTAGQSTKDYGRHEYQMHVDQGENDLPFTIWMTRLDRKNAVRIDSPSQRETVVTHPDISGLELRIPAGAVIRDADGRIVTEVSITPVPIDKMPFPMPYEDLSVFYTIQPGGARIQSADGKPMGATLRYRNTSTQPPGAKLVLFDYDPQGRGWYTYAIGKVGKDGQSIETPKPFVIYQFAASSIAGSGPPGSGAPPRGCGDADPVFCDSGLFMEQNTDLFVPDVSPLEVRREYRQNDPNQRGFGIGSGQTYTSYLHIVGQAGNTAQAFQLVQSNGTAITFNLVGTDPSFVTAGVYYESNEPGEFHKATLRVVRPDATSNRDFWITLRDGRQFSFGFYTTRLGWMTDRFGNRTTITYDQPGRVSRVTSPSGRYIEYQYDVPGCNSCVSMATDHTGRSVIYQYEEPGRLKRVIDPENNVVEYSYDDMHRMTQVKDARQNIKVINEYYTGVVPILEGRIKKQIYPDQRSFHFNYFFDAAFSKIQAAESTDERGAIKRVEYDANGFIIKEIVAKGTMEEQVRSFERDAANLVTMETDSLNRKTKYDYDSAGNLLKKTVKFGTSEATAWNYSYDPVANQIDVETDPLNRKIDHDYDSLGRRVRVTNDLGHAQTMTYRPTGQIESRTRIVGGRAVITRYRYEDGLLAEVDRAGQVTTYYRDALGRATGIKDADGRLSLNYYDDNDRVTQRCNPAGDCTHFTYDQNGNLVRFKRADFQRDFSYDTRNRMNGEGSGAPTEVVYEHEPGGQIKKETGVDGRVMDAIYDHLGRKKHIEYRHNGILTRTVDYAWDKADRVTSITDSVAGVLSYTYDDRFDTIKTEVGPTGRMTYTYYANGLKKTAQPTGGTLITYDYDVANRLKSITQASGGTDSKPATPQTVVIDYDEADRRSKLTLANGVTVAYAWNDNGELERLVYAQADGTPIGDMSYEYDATGQRIGQSGSFARASLPSARKLSPGTDGRVLSDAGAPIGYDGRGRVQTDATRTYIWDDLGLLKEIRETATGTVLANFAYDPVGRRIQRTVGTTTVRYLHDGQNPIQLLSAGGTVLENILSGGIDEWFARTRGGKTSHYLSDALGSTLRLTDSAGVKIVDYTYDSYGNASNDKSTEKNSFQYTGRENDGTGLYYYRARYYNPKWGRFISQDPLGVRGGDNPYLYVEANPISFTDPFGLERLGSIPNPNRTCMSRPPAGLCTSVCNGEQDKQKKCECEHKCRMIDCKMNAACVAASKEILTLCIPDAVGGPQDGKKN